MRPNSLRELGRESLCCVCFYDEGDDDITMRFSRATLVPGKSAMIASVRLSPKLKRFVAYIRVVGVFSAAALSSYLPTSLARN